MANKTTVRRNPVKKQEIFYTREFDAPREVGIKAHTDPELYVRWIGPRHSK